MLRLLDRFLKGRGKIGREGGRAREREEGKEGEIEKRRKNEGGRIKKNEGQERGGN